MDFDTVQQRQPVGCHRENLSFLKGNGNAPWLIANVQAHVEAMFSLKAKGIIERRRRHNLPAEIGLPRGPGCHCHGFHQEGLTKHSRPRAADMIQPKLMTATMFVADRFLRADHLSTYFGGSTVRRKTTSHVDTTPWGSRLPELGLTGWIFPRTGLGVEMFFCCA